MGSRLNTFGSSRFWHKKARGLLGLEKCLFDTILAVQRGQGQGLRDWVR